MKKTNLVFYAKLDNGDFLVAEETVIMNVDRNGLPYIATRIYKTVRGTYNYTRIHGVVTGRSYKSLQALIADDKDRYKELFNKHVVECIV